MSTSSTNSAESPAVSGLDYDDTALTLALPGSSADDRKRAHHDEQDKPPSPKYAAFSYYLPSARCGMASGAGLPAQRAARGGRVQAREGGRGRRPLPAQGGPRRARRVRGPAPRAPRHVRHVPRRPWRRRTREQASGRGHRRRVRAHLRGQGRRLDARRRRPLEDVRRVLQADQTHEELRGRQPSSKTIFPMITRHG